MPKLMPESGCLCPNCNQTLDKPEVQDVLKKTVRAFHAAVKANGIPPTEAMLAAAYIAADLADDIFNTAMPADTQQDDEARENYAETFLGLVVSYAEKTMGVAFEGNEDDDFEEDPFHEPVAPNDLEIFESLKTRH